jgi:hypothetical protein
MAIYKVTTPEGTKYVNAKTQIVALNHCIDTSKHYKAEAVTADELAEAFEKGAKVEKAA